MTWPEAAVPHDKAAAGEAELNAAIRKHRDDCIYSPELQEHSVMHKHCAESIIPQIRLRS